MLETYQPGTCPSLWGPGGGRPRAPRPRLGRPGLPGAGRRARQQLGARCFPETAELLSGFPAGHVGKHGGSAAPRGYGQREKVVNRVCVCLLLPELLERGGHAVIRKDKDEPAALVELQSHTHSFQRSRQSLEQFSFRSQSCGCQPKESPSNPANSLVLQPWNTFIRSRMKILIDISKMGLYLGLPYYSQRGHEVQMGATGSFPPRGWKRNSLTPRTTTFPCPGCEHDVDLGERGINGLFRNFTLETIVERYRQAARAATAIMCDLCKPPPQESTKSCMDCSASYCNECFKIYHPWGTVKAQHEYVGPTTNFRPKEKLSKDIDYLIGKESQVKSQISELNLLMKETECNGERAKEEAITHFEKLFEILEERKSSVLKAIDVSKKLRLDKFQTQVEEYQGLLENNGLVGYAQEVLKETDQSCFVQTAKQLHLRIQKATESLKSFRPAAQTSFEDYVVNTYKQTEVLGELSFFSSGIDVPEINEEQSKVYNNALINWYHPEKDKADSYVLEYRKINRDEDMSWNEIQVCGTNKVVSDLEDNSHYAFRVRAYKGSIYSPCSRELILHTPPAPVFSFLFDEKCGYNNEHLLLNLKRDRVESRAGFNTLLAAERIQVGYYTSLDYIIGDVGITKGKHFWAFKVEPYSYLVKVGVASSNKLQEWLRSPRDAVSPRYEQDSGHDSGSEDTCFDSSQPFTLVTIGMKKFFIPKSPTSNEPENRVLPMPTSIGIFLDYDKGKVGFYDMEHMKCLYERQVDCSHTMYPAFALMGSGAVQLEESITAKYLEYQEDM
ncbi:E3 ubiquitin-protein ligase TRIM36 [Heterocephalus glaber]|uniref:E3 ubiquitin-protein ligase TRIM36 n=1 Tax=Heterocephalus glaber TaxID=10181 RepID=G5C1J1_HETGA|nr:E3 ubiquitin-protein ligase TRIM36 [Heterocephalus glaber]